MAVSALGRPARLDDDLDDGADSDDLDDYSFEGG